MFEFGRRDVDGVIKWFAASNDVGVARLGTAIPKRYIKTAVWRNRIKRIIRESFRHNQEALTGFDVIIVVHKPIKNEAVVLENIKKVWSKVAE